VSQVLLIHFVFKKRLLTPKQILSITCYFVKQI